MVRLGFTIMYIGRQINVGQSYSVLFLARFKTVKANDWHIYETEILEQNDRQSANENVVNDAAATAATIAVNEFVSVNASLDAAAQADNIIINVDEN